MLLLTLSAGIDEFIQKVAALWYLVIHFLVYIYYNNGLVQDSRHIVSSVSLNYL